MESPSFWRKKIGGKLRGFFLFASKGSQFNRHKRLNQKLVASFTLKKIPSLAQLRHLSKFLSPLEKRTIRLAGVIITLSMLTLLFVYYQTRKVIVPAKGGEYIEGVVGYPNNINPLYAMLNPVDADLSRLIYAGLFKYDAKLNLTPDLLDSFSLDKNLKLYTFTLKQNLRWQDGEPLTIEDVRFTIEGLQNSDVKSPLLYGFQNIVFNKIDDRTFTLELPEPYAPFPHLLTTGLLPEHLWTEVDATNMKLSPLNLKPIGAGPYMVSDFTKDSRGVIKTYTLKPNPYYNQASPHLQSLTFKFYSDQGAALEALKSRHIQGLSYLPREEKEEMSKKSLTVQNLRLPQYTAVFFNDAANPLLKEASVRQALNLAVDRTRLIDLVLKGEGIAVWGPILPGQMGYTNKFKTAYEIDHANEILNAGKWEKISAEKFLQTRKNELVNAWLAKKTAEEKKDNAANNRRPAKKTAEEIAALQKEKEAYAAEVEKQLQEQFDSTQKFFRQKSGQTLALSLTAADQKEAIETAKFLKNFWQEIGVQVNLNIADNSRIKSEVIKNRSYEALLYSVIVAGDPDPFPFWHSSQTKHPGLNLALFANRQTDSLLEKARGSGDAKERANYYIDFQKNLSETIPAVFLYNPTYLYIMDGSIQGFTGSRIYVPADRLNSITEWYKKTKISFK